MGVRIFDKDISLISSIAGKAKSTIGSIFGKTGWSGGGGGPASQGPLVPATANELFDGGVSWNNIINIENNTNNAQNASLFIISTQQPNTIYVNNFGFSIPTSATINGITVQINRYADNDMVDNVVMLTDNTETPVGDNKAITAYYWSTLQSSPETYGGSSDLWGATWTPTIINSSKFGLHFKGEWTNYTKYSFLIYVAWVKITVNYTT